MTGVELDNIKFQPVLQVVHRKQQARQKQSVNTLKEAKSRIEYLESAIEYKNEFINVMAIELQSYEKATALYEKRIAMFKQYLEELGINDV